MKRPTTTRRRALASFCATVAIAGCMGDTDETDEDDGDEPEPDATVRVGHDGDLVFEPDTLEIDVGETVEFVWERGGHSLLVLEQPDEADWEGVDDVQDSGFTHRHTFDTAGQYAFECGPHSHEGMDGEILVGDVESGGSSGDEDTSGEDEESDEPTPGGAYDRGLPG